MPILWRYLLGQYFRVLILTVLSIIAALVVTRLDEVAEFAVLGAQGRFVVLYFLYQIPYIIPIALPIACLVSSVLLYQRLSNTHETTSLRAAGMPLRHIVAPVLIAGVYLSLADLYLISEVATSSHLATRRMEHDIKTLSPMILLQHRQLLRHKGAYVDVLGEQENDYATDVLLAAADRSNARTSLLVVKKLNYKDDTLTTEDTSLIYNIPSPDPEGFDHLMIENMSKTETPAAAFTQQIKNDGWRLSRDHLGMSLLLVRLRHEVDDYYKAIKRSEPAAFVAHLGRRVSRCYTEVSRRLSLSFAVFTFTLMGVAFGTDISRNHSKKGIIVVIGLAAMYLTCFFIAKANDGRFLVATTLLTVPHLIIIGLSAWTLNRVTQGIET